MARLPLLHRSTPDTEPGPAHEKARLRRLRTWALVFAVTVSCAAIPPVIVGFGWSVFVMPLVIFTALFPPLLFANRRAVTRMHGDPPPPAVPRSRVAFSFALGLFVAPAVTLWCFQAHIDAARSTHDPVSWDSQTRRLDADQARDTKILNQPAPVVDRDPEVTRLRGQLADAQTRLDKAKHDVICEADGTCGTGVVGMADVYDTKVAYRDEVAAQVTDLQRRLDDATRRVTHDAALLADAQADAAARQRKTDRGRTALGPRPVEATSLDTIRAVADQHKLSVGGVCFGAFAGFLALDLLWLYTIPRRLCRPADDRGGSIEHLVRDREDKDDAGIKYPGELSPGMREKYGTGGGDDS